MYEHYTNTYTEQPVPKQTTSTAAADGFLLPAAQPVMWFLIYAAIISGMALVPIFFLSLIVGCIKRIFR